MVLRLIGGVVLGGLATYGAYKFAETAGSVGGGGSEPGDQPLEEAAVGASSESGRSETLPEAPLM